MTCRDCGSENLAGARFCSACGARLPSPDGETRKLVTIVRCDVTGSTELGESLDPEALRGVMGRYFDAMREALERHGGTVEKYIGDAVMAVFGIPRVHEDDALRAVRAALEMRDALARLNEELGRERGARLQIRTAVTTGEVVAGDPAAGHAFTTGDAANVAARLEASAQPGEILIGEPTYRLVLGAVEAEPVEPLVVKGKREPLSAWRLLAVRPGAEAIPRRTEAPMVGRQSELACILAAFERVRREAACAVVTILGEPGIGKSRLSEEAARAVAGQATVVRGRCLPYGEGITFWPLVEILRQLAGDDDVRAGIARLLGAGGEAVAERAASLVGAADASVASDEAFWAVRKLFERLAHERPLVVVVDDLQWAEPTFLDLLEHVAYLSRAPILLLGLARPEFPALRPAWPGDAVRLTPLSQDESEALIERLLTATSEGQSLGRGRLPSDASAQIAAAAEGNPLFVEQLLAMLESGADAAGELAIPPTIQALLAARLDRLGSDPRRVLECAAAVGQEFWSAAIRELAPPGTAIEPALLELVRQDLIRPQESMLPDEDAFRFVHILVRDAAYAGMPKQRRAELHARLAAWLDRNDRERGERADELVGYHFEQAFHYSVELGARDERADELARAAGERLAGAGRRANLRGDTPAAIKLLERAAQLLPASEHQRLELLPDLASALTEAGELGSAQDVLAEGTRAAVEPIASRCSVQGCLLRLQRGEHTPEARSTAERAIGVFEQHGDDLGLARAWLLLGEVANMAGDRAQMAAASERSAEHARRAGHHRAEADGLRLFGGALVYGPTPVGEAAERLERRLDGAANMMIEAALRSPLAALDAMRGRLDDARAHAARAREIYNELGLTFQLARLAFMTSRIERAAGDLDAAARELRTSCAALEQMGENARLSGLAVQLAGVLCEKGELDEAERWLRRAEDARASAGAEPDFLIVSTRARILARRGHPAAVELADEAATLPRSTDDVDWTAEALRNLGEVYMLAGRPAAATHALREALVMFEGKENAVGASRTRELLEQLAAEPLAERE